MRIERDARIPLRDGVTLTASVFRPDDETPVPGLVSLYPYRKDDWLGFVEEAVHRYFAERGYASLVVDMRGYGGSEGLPWESFDVEPEARDGVDIVEWVAGQPWCDGNVGMFGVSYGAITPLQTASLRPEPL